MTDPSTIASRLSEAQCPHFEDHTPCPEGYLARHAWARRMAKTHRQEKCPGCGLYAIWTPKKLAARAALSPNPDQQED